MARRILGVVAGLAVWVALDSMYRMLVAVV
jgi:hypothetical protein